jgi:molybdenum cofactor cytidylyltransferase
MGTRVIHAVVLAAGESRRMGAPKQLLRFGGKTVLQAVVDALLACPLAGVTVVLGHRAEEIGATLGDRPVRVAVNEAYGDGMLSSVRAGLRALPADATAFLICLGDQPSVDPEVVSRLLDAHRRRGAGIVIPVWRGKRGHPALIHLRHREEIEALSPDLGLKGLMRSHPEDTVEVEVETPAILDDLDTPEDYRKALATHAPR